MSEYCIKNDSILAINDGCAQHGRQFYANPK